MRVFERQPKLVKNSEYSIQLVIDTQFHNSKECYFGNTFIFTMVFNSLGKKNLQIPPNQLKSIECQLTAYSVDRCYEENGSYKIESLTFKI